VRTYSGKGVLATILSSVWSNELHALKSNTEVCSFELAAVGKYIEVGCTETEWTLSEYSPPEKPMPAQ
jgi:hypothetical protein